MSKCGWLAASILGFCCVGHASEASEPQWRSDWEEARKEARASGKPLFVVFRCRH